MPNQTEAAAGTKSQRRRLAVRRALAQPMTGQHRLVYCFWSHMTWLAGARKYFGRAASKQMRTGHAQDFIYTLGLAADCRQRIKAAA